MALLRPQMALVSAGDRWPHVAKGSKRGSAVGARRRGGGREKDGGERIGQRRPSLQMHLLNVTSHACAGRELQTAADGVGEYLGKMRMGLTTRVDHIGVAQGRAI